MKRYLFFAALIVALFLAVSADTLAQTGSILSFGGTNDIVTINSSLGNFGTGDFSVELRVRTSTNEKMYLLSKRSSCSNVNMLSLQLNASGFFVAEISQGGTSSQYLALSNSTDLRDGQWHHLVLTRSADIVRIYVDGVQRDDGVSGANINNGNNLLLASGPCIPANGSVRYQGDMEELRFWSRALCPIEIQLRRNCQLSLPQSGLVAYYNFNQGTANGNNSGVTILNDAVGSNDGTLTGFTLSGSSSNWRSGGVSSTCSSAPSITAGGPTTFCTGGSVTLTTNFGSGYSYQWKNNNIDISGATSQSYTANASGNYAAVVTSNGCATTSAAIVVTVNPLPTPTITVNGATTLCQGDSVTLSTIVTDETPFVTQQAPSSPTVCDCPPGYVAVGYQGRLGAIIDQLQLACKQLNVNGTLGSTIIYTSPNGSSNGGGAVGPYLYTGNTVMVGARIPMFGVNIIGLAGLGQTISYINGNGNNNTGATELDSMISTLPQTNTSFVYVPDGNVITGMSGYTQNGLVTGIAFRYQPVNSLLNPVSVVWSTSATTPSIVVKTSGSYTVTATDGNNCSATTAATAVTVNPLPVFTACPSNITTNANGSTCDAAVSYTVTTSGTPTPSLSYGFTGATTGSGSGNGSGSQFNVGVTNVTINATNDCGSVTCTFTVTINDNENPVVSCPANATVSCDASTATAATGVATATDNCGVTSVTNSDVSTQSANVNDAAHYNYTISRTWTALDVNGNSSSCVQTITVQDVTTPVVACPSNTTVSCDASTAVEANGSATATDNCSPVAITSADVSTQDANANNAGHYNYTITRTWTATDVTGNASTCTQTITVQDVTAPIVACPANATVSCDASTAVAATGSVTGTDNCSPLAITSADASTQSANVNDVAHYNYTITRTWTATDVTGNFTTCVQTITVQDVTAPSIVCPADVTVSCKISVADNGSATGTDNCSPVTITSTDASTQDPNPANTGHYNYTITRTWKAADVTGNFTTCNQVITVHALNNAAVAITPVNTINASHQDHTIYRGYGPQSVTLAATANDGVGAYSYSWSPTTGVANPTAATTSVSPTTTTTYTVAITDGTGCTITQSFTVNVIDVRCGNKIRICHYPPGNNNNPQQLCLPASAIPAHLAHGCVLGDCPQSKNGNSPDEEHYDDHMNGLVVNEVKVYPNPSTGIFIIDLPDAVKGGETVIMDINGKLIERKMFMPDSKLTFDLNYVAKGVYMVEVKNGTQVYRAKVTIN